MRSLMLALGLTPLALAAQDAAPAPAGPDAVLLDRDGHSMAVTDLAYAVEETEAGVVFVTRMPYVPLRTGRGEWRIPLGSIRTITVAEPARPPALARPVALQGGCSVRVAPDGTAAAVEPAPALGDAALDAALAALVRRQGFVAGRGALADRPVRLRVDVQVTPAAAEPVEERPAVTLRLADGTDLSGEPMVAGTWVGKSGAGEYRLALADCASVAVGKAR